VHDVLEAQLLAAHTPSRVQWVIAVVGYEPSEILLQWAPASESPKRENGEHIISRTSSRLWRTPSRSATGTTVAALRDE
jgi:hypothetical protein